MVVLDFCPFSSVAWMLTPLLEAPKVADPLSLVIFQLPFLASSALMVIVSPVFLSLIVSVLCSSSALTRSRSGLALTISSAAAIVGFFETLSSARFAK